MASKRRLRRKSCGSKRQWASQTEAVGHAIRLRKLHPGDTVDAYRCPLCGRWHVGHRPKKVNQSIKARKKASDS